MEATTLKGYRKQPYVKMGHTWSILGVDLGQLNKILSMTKEK